MTNFVRQLTCTWIKPNSVWNYIASQFNPVLIFFEPQIYFIFFIWYNILLIIFFSCLLFHKFIVFFSSLFWSQLQNLLLYVFSAFIVL